MSVSLHLLSVSEYGPLVQLKYVEDVLQQLILWDVFDRHAIWPVSKRPENRLFQLISEAIVIQVDRHNELRVANGTKELIKLVPDLTALDVHDSLHVVTHGFCGYLATHLGELGILSLSMVMMMSMIVCRVVVVLFTRLDAKLLDYFHDFEPREVKMIQKSTFLDVLGHDPEELLG